MKDFKKIGKKPRASLELTDNPRLAAFRVLQETAEGRTPEETLESHCRLLSPRDLSLTTALVYECLRHQLFLDTIIRARLARGGAPLELLIILRLGLAQLFFFSRLGEHAVVMETVTLAKILTPGRHGLVNAILRGLLREREAGQPWPPHIPPSGDALRDLAFQYSCPPWLVKKFHADLGEETEQLLAAINRRTPPTLRVNPLKTDRAALAAGLPFLSKPTPLSPWGLELENFSGQPNQWPGFAEGLFAVQDEASQLAGLLAASTPAPQTILDACAGLGGKGLHLATLHPQASITCLDKDGLKLADLEREAKRLGCNNIHTEPRDLINEPLPPAAYDLVLLDAPCSGLGVIRRRPDLKWNKNPEDLRRLADLQLRLLLNVADSVRPGGRLMFAVCSIAQEEGPENAKKFLAQRPDFTPAPPHDWPEALRPHLSPANTLTLWPHRHNTDGFFWAMFTKA